ncbi:MAG: DUF3168 domain-containing protein [Desulfurellales bacterium]|nr:MAG: DUF3168 domain-containing protein [Desulfurellales bacterium]
MSIEERLRSILIADTAITNLVGQRIRPDELAEGDTYPAILISIDDEDPLAMLSQVGGLQKATINITALSQLKTQARTIAKKVRACLDGFDDVVDGVEIEATFEKRENGFDHDDDGEDTGVYFSNCVFEIWWDESTEGS